MRHEDIDDNYRVNMLRSCMFIFLTLFVATGLTNITTGSVVMSKAQIYQHFLGTVIYSECITLITTGVLVLIVAFLGYYAAIKKSAALLIIFGVCIVSISIIEATVAATTLDTFKKVNLVERMKASMKLYHKVEETKQIWDNLHREFKCCGTNGKRSWNEIQYVPTTCCYNQKMGGIRDLIDDFCEHNEAGNYIYVNGCLVKLRYKVQPYFEVLTGISAGVAFLNITGIALTYIMTMTIRKTEKKRMRQF